MDQVVALPNPSKLLCLHEAFELLCDYLKLPASKNVFFSFFTVQKGVDWVPFRQTQKMFEIFVGKVRSFKERFFLVGPKIEAALATLLREEDPSFLPYLFVPGSLWL